MADKMAAVQGKVTAFLGLTKKSLDGASDSLDGNREITRRLIVRRNMMTRLSWTASARQLLLQGYGCISSVYISSAIAYCISPYASFYAGLFLFICSNHVLLSCLNFVAKVQHTTIFLLRGSNFLSKALQRTIFALYSYESHLFIYQYK